MNIRTALAFASLSLAFLAGGAPAGADQLIRIPTADLAPGPRAEYMRRVDGEQEGYATLLVPVGLAYELAFRYYDNEDGNHRLEGGGMFQLLPDGVITPGIALGLWDVTNSSPWGRRGFLVITKGLRGGQFFVPEGVKRLQFTLGTGTGRLSGVFAAVRLDLPSRFSFIAEYDARRPNFGVWFTPIDQLTLKAELQNGNPYLGGNLTFRF